MPPCACVTQMRWKCWRFISVNTKNSFGILSSDSIRYSLLKSGRTKNGNAVLPQSPDMQSQARTGPHYSNEANQCSDRTTYTTYMRTSYRHAKKQCAMRGVYVCIPSIPTIGLKQGRSKGQGPRFSETAALCFHINKRDSI